MRERDGVRERHLEKKQKAAVKVKNQVEKNCESTERVRNRENVEERRERKEMEKETMYQRKEGQYEINIQ